MASPAKVDSPGGSSPASLFGHSPLGFADSRYQWTLKDKYHVIEDYEQRFGMPPERSVYAPLSAAGTRQAHEATRANKIEKTKYS